MIHWYGGYSTSRVMGAGVRKGEGQGRHLIIYSIIFIIFVFYHHFLIRLLIFQSCVATGKTGPEPQVNICTRAWPTEYKSSSIPATAQ